jgi:hypothetical protein
MAIRQDLADNDGFTAGYQTVQRFVGKLRKFVAPEARTVIETASGIWAEPHARKRSAGWAGQACGSAR